jgi:hypothetical protein
MANESVLFKRGDSATITSTPVIDGQILFDTSGNGKMYLDNGTDRLEMGGAVTVDASLSKTSTNAVQNKAVTGNILNSLTEVDAATQQNTIAGALALKEANSVLKETNSNLGGCSFEQEGNDFYITGADSVRKKLGNPDFKALDCGLVSWKKGEFGQWHHGYHFTKVSEIPDFGAMVHGKDFFIEVYNGGTEQVHASIEISYVRHSDSELVMTSVNGLNSLAVKVYYAVK